MTAEEYYDMQALRSQVNTLIMENGMLKNRCLELERRLKECEDERKEIIQEDTEEKIPPLFIRVVRDFDSSIFAASVTYPDGRIRVLKTGEFFDSVAHLLDAGYSIAPEFMSLFVAEDKKRRRSK
jgi:hypothetical protein